MVLFYDMMKSPPAILGVMKSPAIFITFRFYYVTSFEDLGDQVDRHCDDILREKYAVSLNVLVSGFKW